MHSSRSLLAIIKNIAPDVQKLAKITSSRLIQCLLRRAKPASLLVSETSVDVVTQILDVINIFVEDLSPERDNSTLVSYLWRARASVESLRVLSQMNDDELFTLASSLTAPGLHEPASTDEAEPSEKGRGKRPLTQSGFPPNLKRKLAELPLGASVSIIDKISELVSGQSDTDALTSAVSEDSRRSSIMSLPRAALASEESSNEVLSLIREIVMRGQPRRSGNLGDIEPFRFEPTIASLFASYYWGLIISQDMQRASETGKGIWFGTRILLFGVRAGQVQGPSLWSPKGAVDAVGESLFAGVRDLTMRAKRSMSSDAT